MTMACLSGKGHGKNTKCDNLIPTTHFLASYCPLISKLFLEQFVNLFFMSGKFWIPPLTLHQKGWQCNIVLCTPQELYLPVYSHKWIRDGCVLGNTLGSEGNIRWVYLQYITSENDMLYSIPLIGTTQAEWHRTVFLYHCPHKQSDTVQNSSISSHRSSGTFYSIPLVMPKLEEWHCSVFLYLWLQKQSNTLQYSSTSA